MSQPLPHTPPSNVEPGGTGAKPLSLRHEPVFRGDLDAVLSQARKRIAPLWPLRGFVAVNPFLGLTSQRFEEACQTQRRITGAEMLMPRRYYRNVIAEGRVTEEDLAKALTLAQAQPGAPKSLSELKEALGAEPHYHDRVFTTAADVVDRIHGSRTRHAVVEEISKWCGAFWDDGQSAWRMPWRHLSFYSAWRSAAAIDRTADVLRLGGFRQTIATLPEDPVATIATVIATLGLPLEVLDGYFHRALFSVGGWVSYARYLGWHEELAGNEDDTVIQLLAVRLAWDYALFQLHDDADFRNAWQTAVEAMRESTESTQTDDDLVIDAIAQGACETAFQRELLERLLQPRATELPTASRKPLQAAFCIDVRSEVYRRALEKVVPQAQTMGFAGFFAIPLEYVPIGQPTGSAQCPVLIQPKYVVCETVAGADDDERDEILGLRVLRRRAANAWKSFKSSAVSSFVYVETVGLAFAAKLIGDATGMTRPVTHPSADGLDPGVLARVAPELSPGSLGVRQTGFTDSERIDTAEAVLRAMSLTHDFARLVMLAGHGSTMVNNPHASGYDCGACGGNPGDSNARVTAAIFNDPEVRKALAERGIVIPDDTWFLGCLHDTSTDEITIFDRELIPETHAKDVEQLESWLAEASSTARHERAELLNVGDGDVDASVIHRSRDWSQVRPEWGLARNAAFIAAPRKRTSQLNLQGRVFLHDYTWQEDTTWRVLEIIMTAPMVVANWISLQYYGSSVNGDAFGSGNKVLHNVVGTLGVLEGNGGDLRVGLPLQAVHDGKRLVHEPLRLNVFIEAPTEQIDATLEKHANVRELVDNRWLHLFALADEGKTCLRYAEVGVWEPALGALG